MHYHSSLIDTLNLSAKNHGKRTKKVSVLPHFLGRIPPIPNVCYWPVTHKIIVENLASLHAKIEFYYKGNE